MVKIQFALKLILFQKTLQYVIAINLCYGQWLLHLQASFPNGPTRDTIQAITEIFNLVVQQSFLNQ